MKSRPFIILIIFIISIIWSCNDQVTPKHSEKEHNDSVQTRIWVDSSAKIYWVDVEKYFAYSKAFLKESKVSNNQLGVAYGYSNLSLYNLSKKNIDLAQIYADSCLAIATELQLWQLMAKILIIKGNFSSGLHNNKKALQYYDSAEKTLLKQQHKIPAKTRINMLTEVYECKSIEYRNMGQLDHSLTYAFQSLSLDSVENSKAYQILAGIYTQLNQNEKALYYIDKAIAMTEKLNQHTKTAQFLMSRSYIETHDHTIHACIKDSEKAVNISKKTNRNDLIYMATANLLNLYIDQNKQKQAQLILDTILPLDTSLDKNTTQLMYGLIGNFYKNTKQDEKAIQFYKDAEKSNTLWNKAIIYESISEVYYQMGDYKNALDYFKKYTHLNDSLNGLQMQVKTEDLSQKYESEKKQKEINELSYKAEINSAQKSRLIAILVGLGCLILLISAASLLYLRFLKTKQERVVSNLRQKMLISQMNPHFISNTLMIIQSFIAKNQTQEAIEHVGKFGSLTRRILESSREDYTSIEKEVTLMKDYLDLMRLVEGKKLQYEILVDPSIDQEFEEIPTMFIQPFVENALKHGFSNQEQEHRIRIEIKQESKNLRIIIFDNGKKALDDLFNRKKNSYSLQIFEERIQAMRKSVKYAIQSVKNELGEKTGTEVRIQITI